MLNITETQLAIGKNSRVPVTKEHVEEMIEAGYKTPFHIYDEKGIMDTAEAFNKTFSWVPGEGYQNFFAVKACPNNRILRILKEVGFGTDCSSLPELVMSEREGISGENVMFTSNNTPDEEFVKAKEMGAIINLDDITHIDALERTAGIPELICFRYNPGLLREGNDIIGNPVEAKYGVTKDQIVDAYKRVKELGARRFGLHTMIVSNMRDEEYLIETGRMLFELVREITEKADINFEFVNLGGGVGIPYQLTDKTVDLDTFSQGVKQAYDELIKGTGLDPLRVVTECGRAITGPNGWLITKVRHIAKKYKDYVGVDACMANLMRPALYGAYHHITVLGKEDGPFDHQYDVTGSLCENNDKFAVDRWLPEIEVGDIIAIHEAGAHGYAMGFNYNGKLRSSELLLRSDGKAEMIRRAEKMDDYFATLSFKD
jgi:diaminopimelate decarboxylase